MGLMMCGMIILGDWAVMDRVHMGVSKRVRLIRMFGDYQENLEAVV